MYKRQPSIHPLIAIEGCSSAPHTPEFADDAIGAAAGAAIVDGALAMALTVVDAVTHLRDGQRLVQADAGDAKEYHGWEREVPQADVPTTGENQH